MRTQSEKSSAEKRLVEAYDLLQKRLLWRCERDLAKAEKLAAQYGEDVKRRWLECQAEYIRDKAHE